MNQQLINIMFSLLRYEVSAGTPLCDTERAFVGENLMKLYKISKSHDLAHLVGHALARQELLAAEDEYARKFEKEQFLAVYRYEQIQYELNEICRVLEKAEIMFMPLKGSVIRSLYPEPWMRTSCDIDILVKEEDLPIAARQLEQDLGYVKAGAGPHDIAFNSPSGVHLELHFLLVEEGQIRSGSDILREVWTYATPIDQKAYQHKMNDEMFYFYHTAHMAKHFIYGGCGIRPFIDLWILNHSATHSNDQANVLLEQGGLLTFSKCTNDLAEIWFSGAEYNETSMKMEKYILGGGVYGAIENRISAEQIRKGGKLRYALSRIFLPYDVLKYVYPILQKHKWLLPIMQIRRWCRLIFEGRLGSSLYELNANRKLSKESAVNTTAFIEEIGL